MGGQAVGHTRNVSSKFEKTVDTSKLLRLPLERENLGGWVDSKSFQTVHSPDAKFKVVFSHFHEVRMGTTECLFALLDNQDKIIDNFEPLIAISSKDCCWSDNSSCFALAFRVEKDYGYIIVRLPSLDFSVIKIFNPYPLDVFFRNDTFFISYNDQQFAASNTDKLSGGATTALPYKKYLKPTDLQFPLTTLNFFSRDRLKSISALIATDKEYRHELIDGGFNEFHGTLPQDTVTGYNGRAFEVYQLEAFAEYGDKVSKYWLEEIKRKTNNNYNKWTKVTDYIGHRRRQDDEKICC